MRDDRDGMKEKLLCRFGDKNIIVHPVSAFGDCLYIALMRQLHQHVPAIQPEEDEVQHLRNAIAAHIATDIERFRGALHMNGQE